MKRNIVAGLVVGGILLSFAGILGHLGYKTWVNEEKYKKVDYVIDFTFCGIACSLSGYSVYRMIKEDEEEKQNKLEKKLK